MKHEKQNVPVMVDWRVSADGLKIVFEVQDGGELFTMDAERFGLLLNGDYVRGLLQEAAQERLFPAEWGLEKFVEAQRLFQKGLNMAQIAGLWAVPEPMLRAFYAQAVQKFQHSPQEVQNESERQGTSEREKDHCQSLKYIEARPGEQGGFAQVFLEVPYVARLLKEQYGIPLAVSSQLMLDPDDFKAWIKANQKYLDLFKS